MRFLKGITIGLLILGLAAPAMAQTVNQDTGNFSPGTTQAGAAASATAQGGQGGNAQASSNPVQVNTQITDVTTVQGQNQHQGQQQGQAQQQGQGQAQGQKQNANNEGNHQSVNVDVPRQAPPAIPAALAVSSLTCYGSWSIAASTPFGGIGAGFPTKDADCERSRNALILVNLGLKDAALALLGQNEDTARAMEAAGVKYPGQKVAATEPIPDLKLNTPLGEEKKSEEEGPTNFGQRTSMTIPEALVANLAAQSVGAGQ